MEKKQGVDFPPLPPRDKDEESLIEEHDENGTRVRRYEKSKSADIQEPAVQIETKEGASWTEPEPQKPLGRKRVPKKVVVDTKPPVQVETKTPLTEADLGVELMKTAFIASKRENHEPMPAVFRSNRGRPKKNEAIVMPPSGTEQLHEPIDFGKELKNIRSGTKEEQKQKLANFKEKLIEQKKGIAEIQKKLFEEVEKNPDAEVWEYLDVVKNLQEKHDLSDDQRFAIEKGLEAYSRTHKAIREKTEDCIDEDGKIDGLRLYEKIFNQKPQGRVEVILRPAVIYLRIEDLDDYAVAYNHGAIDQVTNEMKGEADSSGGCLLNNIPGLEGAVALEKATNGRFDKMDKYSNATLQHEEQHAFNKIINRGYNAEWERDLTDKDLGEIGIEDQVKDEISAFFRDGRSAEEIRRILLDPKTIYKYGFEYKKREKEESKFSQKYVDLVENGIQAYANLLEAGHSKEDAQALLFVEPLSKWSKTTERLLGEDKTEGTPKEWREKLRALIEGAKEKVGMSERGERMKAYLAERSKALGEKAKEYGANPEKLIRDMGEQYNKLSFKQKLLFGLGLGAGATIFSGVSTPLTLLFAGGLSIQRAGGMASMYLRFEKHLQDTVEGKSKGILGRQEWYKKIFEGSSEKQRKVMAAFMSVGYTAVMSAVIGGTIKMASESQYGEAVHDWLRHHYPFGEAGASATGAAATDAAPTPVPAESGMGAEVPHTAAVAAAPEHSVIPVGHQASADVQYQAMRAVETGHQASADVQAAALRTAESNVATILPEMPSVEVSSGHGSEWMMKRLWEQLQGKGLDPNAYAEGSDVRRLLETNAQSIDKVVHQIAADPKHGFFHEGASIRIGAGAHMTIGADGSLELNNTIHAPMGAHLAPAVSAVPTPPAETVVMQPIPAPEVALPPHGPPPIAAPPIEHAPAHEPVSVETPPAHIESSNVPFVSPPEAQPLSSETIMTPDTTVEKVGITDNPEFVGQPHVETPPEPAEEAMTQPPAPVIEHSFISNKFDLKIPVAEPHVYSGAGGKDLLVYGGSLQERKKAMLEFFLKNPGKIIFGADADGKYRLPWHLVDGKVILAGLPPKVGGFFGFGSSWMKAPEPDELEKLIK